MSAAFEFRMRDNSQAAFALKASRDSSRVHHDSAGALKPFGGDTVARTVSQYRFAARRPFARALVVIRASRC